MAQAWPEVGGTRTGRKDQRSRGDDSSHRATTLITPFPVPIRPGPPLPEVQAGLPGQLMLVGSQHPGSRSLQQAPSGLLPQTRTLRPTYLKSCLGSSASLSCLLSQRFPSLAPARDTVHKGRGADGDVHQVAGLCLGPRACVRTTSCLPER